MLDLSFGAEVHGSTGIGGSGSTTPSCPSVMSLANPAQREMNNEETTRPPAGGDVGVGARLVSESGSVRGQWCQGRGRGAGSEQAGYTLLIIAVDRGFHSGGGVIVVAQTRVALGIGS